MITVIVYYSMGGNTEWVARQLAERLGARTLRLEPVKAYPDKGFRKFFWGGKSAVMAEAPALAPYVFDADVERVIIGFPVWAGTVTPPIRTFVQENGAALKGKSIAAFACQSGSGAEKALDKLTQLLGVEKLDARLVLNDPKDRPNPDNAAAIDAFCRKL